MRRALQSPAGIGQRSSEPQPLAAPVKGWNARDAKAAMGSQYAFELINWFPGTATINIRPGCSDWVTGINARTETLMTYASPTEQKLFASTDLNIYDVSTEGAIGASVASCTSGAWSFVNFNTVGGSFLVLVNGVDSLKLYNGTAWSVITGVSAPIAITGVTTSTLETVSVFKRRLWFTQKDSMSLWYLDTNALGGAATEFPVGQIFARGGKVVATTSWTIDGGVGMDDHFVIITSEGEIAVYKGTDPDDATLFSLHGVYFAGKPLGNRCFSKLNGDVVILTEKGVLTLSKLLAGQSSVYTTALTSVIDGAFAEAVRYYKDNFGWTCVVHPLQNALIVNIPTTNSSSIQFVMNTITGAWCQFQGWPAIDVIVFGSELFYSANTKIVKAWSGANDFGNDISALCQQAYSYFGSRGVLKQVKLVRPILEFDYSIRLELGIDVDFDDRTTYNEILVQRGSTSEWDSAVWDLSVWASGTIVEDNWRMVDSKVGQAISLRLRIRTKTSAVSWTATDIIFQKGSIFG